MIQYQRLLRKVLNEGESRSDRTGVGTIGLFGVEAEYVLGPSYALGGKAGLFEVTNFPLVTLKRTSFHNILTEMLWMISGDTNLRFLHEHNVHIWDEWADSDGNLGPVYGAQLRRWNPGHIDQLAQLITNLRDNPYSRRHVISLWNVGQLSAMKLPPCPVLLQFYVDSEKRLSLKLTQRSADMFLGVPYDIAGYSLLLCIVAVLTGYEPYRFIHSIGDAHIYRNHLDQVATVLNREVKMSPILHIRAGIESIDTLKHSDFVVLEYNPHPAIKAPIAV